MDLIGRRNWCCNRQEHRQEHRQTNVCNWQLSCQTAAMTMATLLRSCLLALGLVAAALGVAQMSPLLAQVAQSPPLAPPLAQSPAAPLVDLELVLAVDVSLSMDLEEQRLQRDGYVQAFRDADVLRAIASGGARRIAVTYVEWAGEHVQSTILPWTLIDGAGSAAAFADALAAMPITRARMTSISGALQYAMRLFGQSPFRTSRRVVDVSGDGPNNAGPAVTDVRDSLVAQGIIINGLPIVIHVGGAFDLADLDRYYADCVIGGPGAFLLAIRDKAEFAPAIRRKLILEIASVPPPPARVIRTQLARPAGGVDCLVGEKMWRLYMQGRFRE